jgi:hypothetical protein
MPDEVIPFNTAVALAPPLFFCRHVSCNRMISIPRLHPSRRIGAAMLLGMRSSTLMVRSAAKRRVLNHEARRGPE